MSNKTFIPAFKAKVGDWEYYICIMKYAEVARQIDFAYELGGNIELNNMIQRGISARTKDIKEYLLNSEHRFLGSLIVAVWGGQPSYQPLSMEDPDGILSGIDRQFGVLTFDGTQQYFALDGQHRLRAIKESIRQKPEIGTEDICVIMVSHFDTEAGRVKTRRLFTNINRNAKATTGAENIVLDEDDGPAIVTRRLLNEHSFLKNDGIVKVFTRQGDEGDLKLAAGNVPPTDKKAFTTIINLYDIVRCLCFDLDPSMRGRNARPTDNVLEVSYVTISKRLDDLIQAAGDVKGKLEAGTSVRDLRAPKNNENNGHAFMRPVIQKAVVRVIRDLAQQGVLDWDSLMARLAALPWAIGEAPWISVFNTTNGKMITAKENVELLDPLLYAHIAASSKAAVQRARKSFKDVRGFQYPVSEADLMLNHVAHEENRSALEDTSPTPAAAAVPASVDAEAETEIE